jgi:hypothetical protein
MTAIRTLLTLAALYNLELRKLDVKTAYLNSELEEPVYMLPPKGFGRENPEKVWKLYKSLYGLPQSARNWYLKIRKDLVESGYEQSDQEPCIFSKIDSKTGKIVILGLFVDDIILLTSEKKYEREFLKILDNLYKYRDEGEIESYLNIEVDRDRTKKTIFIHQQRYVEMILKKYKMQDCKICDTPIEVNIKLSNEDCPKTEEEKAEMMNIDYLGALGSLMYLMVCTRPDIAYAVGFLSRFSHNPGIKHWKALKRVFRYLKGTSDLGIELGGKITDTTPILIGYADADFAGDLNDRRSTTGYVFAINNAGLLSWKSAIQKAISLSTVEAEIRALKDATKEAIALRCLLKDLGHIQNNPTTIHEDNQGTIFLAKNNTRSDRTKHLTVIHKFVNEKIEDKTIELKYVKSRENWADIFTKPIARPEFLRLRSLLGLRPRQRN